MDIGSWWSCMNDFVNWFGGQIRPHEIQVLSPTKTTSQGDGAGGRGQEEGTQEGWGRC